MKNFFFKIGQLMPHITMISSMMIIVFYVIDLFNKFMGFMRYKYTTAIIMVMAVTAFISSVMLIYYQRKHIRAVNRKIDRRAARKAAREDSEASAE